MTEKAILIEKSHKKVIDDEKLKEKKLKEEQRLKHKKLISDKKKEKNANNEKLNSGNGKTNKRKCRLVKKTENSDEADTIEEN